MPTLNAKELHEFMVREFPQSRPERLTIEAVSDNFVRIRRRLDDSNRRPGGTVSGPTLTAMVDESAYLVILAMIGPVAMAVTTSLTINFLRMPPLGDVIAETRLLKLGKRLAVAESFIYSDGMDEPVAQATATYSIPPRP